MRVDLTDPNDLMNCGRLRVDLFAKKGQKKGTGSFLRFLAGQLRSHYNIKLNPHTKMKDGKFPDDSKGGGAVRSDTSAFEHVCCKIVSG